MLLWVLRIYVVWEMAAFYLADLNVPDSATRKEQTYMVGDGNDMKIGTHRI